MKGTTTDRAPRRGMKRSVGRWADDFRNLDRHKGSQTWVCQQGLGYIAPVNARVWGTVVAFVAFSGIGVTPTEARSGPARPMAQCTLPNVATGTRTCTYTFVHTDTI